MGIQFYNEDVELPVLDYDLLQKVLKFKIRVNKGKLGTINYIFCSDEYLLELNVKFLNHDFYTDVITFDYSVDSLIGGDIYISTDRVRSNSVEFNQDYADEMVRVVAHGLLHLLQYNDKDTDETMVMRKMETLLLNKYQVLEQSKLN